MTESPIEADSEIEVFNPADAAVIARIPVDSAATVRAKVANLRAHQRDWEDLGPRGREVWLRAFQDWILDNESRIADVLQSETGKTRADAVVEAPAVADLIKYWSGHARRYLADTRARPHSPLFAIKALSTNYRPYPVVGVITPWNFPFAAPAMDTIPALAAGAAVLVKPSEVTPLSAIELVKGWREIGAPPVFDLAIGRGDTGAAVTDQVDFVQFTGSTRTGRRIAVRCAERLIPCSLELGGKDPALVLADADIDRAVNGITWGGMVNSGQVCTSVERVYVETPVYDEFVGKLVAKVDSLRQGKDGKDFRFDIGAMATPAQRDLVARHIDDAVAGGARVLTGGTPRGGFYEPTVLVDVDHTMACIREETFGPTLPVIEVADEAEAIRLANDSEFALSASVWTRDTARGLRVARRIEAGAVNVNDVMANAFCVAVPMGGWKQSGMGARFGGRAGILKYCRAQAITAPRLPAPSDEVMWYPSTRLGAGLATAVMRATAARGLRRIGLRAPRRG
ncbi:aldehyde dehydrogenase family protein [Nocardia alni]|uniref:aldehyde dehydrogenase family protein n=1 Tax=Nocardia alni TaxID=2815723 RepID=UPI001C23A3A4|nr:aldehyde dehydrogenase family protein [Nocardia alni]